MIQINPQQIYSKWWAKGFALDFHTISSTKIEDGKYNNEYSDVGKLLNQIKYHKENKYIPELGKIASDFIRGKYKKSNEEYPYPILHGIICVPPSNEDRPFQPVFEIGKEIYNNIHIPILNNLEKIKKTPVMKNLSKEESKQYLNGAFKVIDNERLNGKNILLLDDLYGTGTTLTEIAKTIKDNSNVKDVFVLTITKTRTSSGLRSNNTEEINDLPF